MFSVTKQYRNLPFAHRQPNHKGHCRFIHGHNWAFEITFQCDRLDSCGFVIDIGALKPVRDFLEMYFDHTLVLNQDDPLLKHSEMLNEFAHVILVRNCGMEGLAQHVMLHINRMLLVGELDLIDALTAGEASSQRGVMVTKVVCHEDDKNSATFEPKD